MHIKLSCCQTVNQTCSTSVSLSNHEPISRATPPRHFAPTASHLPVPGSHTVLQYSRSLRSTRLFPLPIPTRKPTKFTSTSYVHSLLQAFSAAGGKVNNWCVVSCKQVDQECSSVCPRVLCTQGLAQSHITQLVKWKHQLRVTKLLCNNNKGYDLDRKIPDGYLSKLTNVQSTSFGVMCVNEIDQQGQSVIE